MYIQKLKLDFLKNYCVVLNQILYESFQVSMKWKFDEMMLGHMTKMAATPIYGKKPSNIFFSGTGGPISRKLGM